MEYISRRSLGSLPSPEPVRGETRERTEVTTGQAWDVLVSGARGHRTEGVVAQRPGRPMRRRVGTSLSSQANERHEGNQKPVGRLPVAAFISQRRSPREVTLSPGRVHTRPRPGPRASSPSQAPAPHSGFLWPSLSSDFPPPLPASLPASDLPSGAGRGPGTTAEGQ